MAEHLAVISQRTLRQLLRTKNLAWTRRRREAPVGRVHVGDAVFFKHAGRWVVAAGTVARVREQRAGGRYLLALKFRTLHRLRVPFPIVKRDRRSWVVCATTSDPGQQHLLGSSSPTLTQLLEGVRGRRRLSPQAVRKLLAAYAGQPGTETHLLMWLALLAVATDSDNLDEALRGYFKKPSQGVFPFAVFS